MPSSSKKQHNLMAAVAHSPSFAKKVGIKQSVGKEFMSADKGKKFAGGGEMKSEKAKEIRHAKTLEKLAKEERAEAAKMKKGGKVFGGKETKAEEARERKAAPSKAAYKKAEMKFEGEAMKRGGCVKKMAAGGKAKGTDVKIAMSKKEPAGKGMAGMMPPRPQAAPSMAPRPMGAAPMMCGGGKVKKMAGGGLAAGHKYADGVATKGKTKGKEVTMARGGATKKRYC